jgi:hypothetical protein
MGGRNRMSENHELTAENGKLVEERPAKVPVSIIAFHPSGFEVRIRTDILRIGGSIKWLEKQGYRPQRGFEMTPAGLPICPKHNQVMPERNKQNDTWYSHNASSDPDNPVWCKGFRDSKSSPGWEL